jgi:hypothetical protein
MLAVMMEAVSTSETPETFYESTRRNFSEDSDLQATIDFFHNLSNSSFTVTFQLASV